MPSWITAASMMTYSLDGVVPTSDQPAARPFRASSAGRISASASSSTLDLVEQRWDIQFPAEARA